MGFRNGTKPGAANRKGHRWINYPNNAHKKCTECCMKWKRMKISHV